MSHTLETAVFAEIAPAGLGTWVESIWYFEGVLEHRLERVLPSATGDLVINLSDPIALVEGQGDAFFHDVSVSGLMLEPMVLGHPKGQRVLGLRLTPLGLRAVLGMPSGELLGQALDSDSLEVPATDLYDALAYAHGPQDALAAAAAWARARVAAASPGDPIVRWAHELMARRGGQVQVRRLAKASGYSATQLNARFRSELGLSPKRFARLVRFRRSLDALRSGRPLAEIAADCGFYDQAHMNAEFRTFADRTPRQVRGTVYPSGLTLVETP